MTKVTQHQFNFLKEFFVMGFRSLVTHWVSESLLVMGGLLSINKPKLAENFRLDPT